MLKLIKYLFFIVMQIKYDIIKLYNKGFGVNFNHEKGDNLY